MDDSRSVRMGKSISDIEGDLDRLRDREASFTLESMPQRFTIDHRHRIERSAIPHTGIEKRDDVRMLESRQYPDFLDESLRRDGIGDFGFQNFEGYEAIVLQLAGNVNAGHSSTTDLAEDLVARRRPGGR
jgi:hypothetical protein